MMAIYLKNPPKAIHFTIGLAVVNLVWRLIWLTTSHGAYTDGILQITMFDSEQGTTFWPPLYTLLALPMAWVPGLGLEGSARLVSVVAGALMIFPIEAIARRLFGLRAALMAMLAYTASPMPLRWSLQVMTDSTFALLWTSSLAAVVIAAQASWPALFAKADSTAKPNSELAGKWMLLASILGALATLTRYQGIFLLPVLGLMAWRMEKMKDSGGASSSGSGLSLARRPVVSLAVWAIVPVWVMTRGFSSIAAHLTQMGERTVTNSLGRTLLTYWDLFEVFVLTLPYFITHGIFGFFLFGLFRIQFGTKRIRNSAFVALYLALAVLTIQSVFQAYQERYLLPLVPMVCIIAGHGFAVWERKCADRPARFWSLAGPALVFGLVFSAFVAVNQGNPFLDMKQAGRYLSELPEDAVIVSTERYNKEIDAAKLTFWSGGREIIPFYNYVTQAPRPGDYIVLSSFYGGQAGGGWSHYQRTKADVEKFFPAREVAKFAYVSHALFPDIMSETFAHTNTLAFPLRYQRQDFETTILQVVPFGTISDSAEDAEPAEPAPASTPQQPDP